MRDVPNNPKDVADLLEAIARKLRSDPAMARALAAPRSELTVSAPPAGDPYGEEEPGFGAVDVFADETHVTVTVETRNVDPGSVHVSLAEGRLFLGAGEGNGAVRRDLSLPVPVDEDGAYATFRNGILDVVLPRRKATARR